MRSFKNLSAGISIILLLISVRSSAQEKREQPAIRIVMIGDSTMASYAKPPKDRPDLTGWGQVFGDQFNPRVTIINHAESGRSSRSFIREGRWARALQERPDYIFIQFGHNDGPGKGDRSTDPKTSFRDNLRKFVDESRAANVKPIFVTPMTRRKFHEGKIVTSLRPYAEAMLAVGKEKDVPVIDLHTSSVKLHNKLGKEGSAYFNPSVEDKTHFTRKGAEEICQLVAEELSSKVPALGAYLKSSYSEEGKIGAGNPIERLRREGIRAKSHGDVEKIEPAGFNLVLPWGGDSCLRMLPGPVNRTLRLFCVQDKATSFQKKSFCYCDHCFGEFASTLGISERGIRRGIHGRPIQQCSPMDDQIDS